MIDNILIVIACAIGGYVGLWCVCLVIYEWFISDKEPPMTYEEWCDSLKGRA